MSTHELFGAGVTTTGGESRRKAAAAMPDRQMLALWPYLHLHLFPDGTAGGASALVDARYERLEFRARERLAAIRAEADFIERWLMAPKREGIDLIA